MKVLVVASLVAIGLAFLLVWKSPLITGGTYRICFVVGLAALAAILCSPGDSWGFHIPASASIARIPITYLAITPYLLLVESGIAGYRGFSSWARYLSLVLAILGGLGLVASVLLPRLLRRL